MSRRYALFAAVLLFAACGGEAGGTATTSSPISTTRPEGVTTTQPASAYPVEVGGVVIPARPERILSGSATHTEILFALGAGDQVAAVDLWSDHPPEAIELPRFDAFDASVEAMAAFDPDLVILSFDPGIVEGLEALGIPAVVLDAPGDIEGIFAQYAEIARAVGRVDESAVLIARMRDEIADVVAKVPDGAGDLTYYHELDPSLFSLGSDTYIGSLYGLLGLSSIVDGAGGGWLQLSAEYIFDADPDFVFLADAQCCGQSPEVVAARPGWNALGAVAGGRVFEVDESMSSRWGPRVVDFLRSVVAMLEEAS